ncbi:MAG: hypothetical protein RRY79_00240 [Clostridia bacterium]
MPKKKQNVFGKTPAEIATEMYLICMNREEKTSDRISAAKLLLDVEERMKTEDDNKIVVTFEDIDEEFLV